MNVTIIYKRLYFLMILLVVSLGSMRASSISNDKITTDTLYGSGLYLGMGMSYNPNIQSKYSSQLSPFMLGINFSSSKKIYHGVRLSLTDLEFEGYHRYIDNNSNHNLSVGFNRSHKLIEASYLIGIKPFKKFDIQGIVGIAQERSSNDVSSSLNPVGSGFFRLNSNTINMTARAAYSLGLEFGYSISKRFQIFTWVKTTRFFSDTYEVNGDIQGFRINRSEFPDLYDRVDDDIVSSESIFLASLGMKYFIK